MIQLLLLFGGGCLAGALNVVAGGGSFLTLPLLMFAGLPPGVANGTNRIGILLQNAGAVASFERQGVTPRGWLLRAALPATGGACLGVWLALQVSDLAFQRILAALMILLTLWSLWRRPGESPSAAPRVRSRGADAALAGAFFLVGVYGGFVQAGVGFLVLAVTTLAGLDLVRGNAVKVLAVLCWTAVALLLFALSGRVDWPLGLSLGAGMLLGGVLGARLTVLKGHRWLRRVVTLAILLLAAKLWIDSL